MFFWKTHKLAEDIKNETLSDNKWKNYYLAGSILMTFTMYLAFLTTRTNKLVMLVEAISIVGVIIFGVSITYNTNQAGNGNGMNYIARLVALSLPLQIKFCVLSIVFGAGLGIFSEVLTPTLNIQEWSIAVFTVLVEVLIFWRLYIHLQNINT
jgi:uncharacterized membrane protein